MKPSCVIALHGLGADGSDLMPLREMMGLSDVPWLFPDAPVMPVTVNGGMKTSAWFDILGFQPIDPVDAQGIRHSAQVINMLIAQQVAQGIDASRMVLLGFSQGGVIALHAALSAEVQIGAVVGLSTWLPAEQQLNPLATGREALPVWLGHGTADNIVPLAAAERAQNRLSALGVVSVRLETYPMAHSIMQQELDDVVAWLEQV
jgi:phospholipase/carboxylesterase